MTYRITIYDADSDEPTQSHEYDAIAEMPTGIRLFVEATEEGLVDPAAPPYRWTAEVWASETDGLRIEALGGDRDSADPGDPDDLPIPPEVSRLMDAQEKILELAEAAGRPELRAALANLFVCDGVGIAAREMEIDGPEERS